jgi:hypothetical protein
MIIGKSTYVSFFSYFYYFFYTDMAQIITARLARNDATPWGFRLQGGKDFGTPLLIQKVSFAGSMS